MTIEIACPQCRGHEIGELPPEKQFSYFNNNPCKYCENTGKINLMKHYFIIGEHKKIKSLKRFIRTLGDYKRNKIQNERY